MGTGYEYGTVISCRLTIFVAACSAVSSSQATIPAMVRSTTSSTRSSFHGDFETSASSEKWSAPGAIFGE